MISYYKIMRNIGNDIIHITFVITRQDNTR